MYNTYLELREKGLSYTNADDITNAIHFIQLGSQMQEVADKFNVDLNEFRAKDFNSKGSKKIFNLAGATMLALVRRGILELVRVEDEEVTIPAYIYEFKDLKTSKIIKKWWVDRNEKEKYFNKELYEDVTEYITVESQYNVYKFNEINLALIKTVLVNTILAL